MPAQAEVLQYNLHTISNLHTVCMETSTYCMAFTNINKTRRQCARASSSSWIFFISLTVVVCARKQRGKNSEWTGPRRLWFLGLRGQSHSAWLAQLMLNDIHKWWPTKSHIRSPINMFVARGGAWRGTAEPKWQATVRLSYCSALKRLETELDDRWSCDRPSLSFQTAESFFLMKKVESKSPTAPRQRDLKEIKHCLSLSPRFVRELQITVDGNQGAFPAFWGLKRTKHPVGFIPCAFRVISLNGGFVALLKNSLFSWWIINTETPAWIMHRQHKCYVCVLAVCAAQRQQSLPFLLGSGSVEIWSRYVHRHNYIL